MRYLLIVAMLIFIVAPAEAGLFRHRKCGKRKPVRAAVAKIIPNGHCQHCHK